MKWAASPTGLPYPTTIPLARKFPFLLTSSELVQKGTREAAEGESKIKNNIVKKNNRKRTVTDN